MKIIPISEIEEVIHLLEECNLPADDIGSNQQVECYGIRDKSNLIGLVGLEVLGSVALLRSLAVSLESRGNSIGKELVNFAESRSASLGVSQLYLLTTTAYNYFERLGYKVINRDLAPEQIRQTSQFSSICPSSAVFMVKEICS